MSRPRRILRPAFLAATLATLVVACTSAPTRTAIPAPLVTNAPSTTSATALPAATPPPTATCPPDGGFSDGSIDVRLIDGFETIELDAVEGEPAGTPDPGEPVETIDPADFQVVGTALGGTDMPTSLAVDTPIAGDVATITELSAEFVPFGGGEPLAVGTSFDAAAVTLRLPDREVRGTLRVSATWTTQCGAGEGTGTIRLAVLPATVAAGCPSDDEGLQNTVVLLQEEQVQLDTIDVQLGIVGWSGRWIPAVATDEIPRFAGWDQGETLTVEPGASVVLREAVDDLRLVSIRVTFYDRADVLAYLDPSSTDDVTTLDVIRRNAGAQGRAGIPAPLDPGRYVFEVVGVWQTSCLNLDTYAVIGVDVR